MVKTLSPEALYDFPPCVGCGYCCMSVTCGVGQDVFGISPLDRCPALRWEGERYWCGLADVYRETLAIGAGCTSSLNSWRRDVKKRRHV